MPHIITSPSLVSIPYRDSATFTVTFEFGLEFPEHSANFAYPTLFIPSGDTDVGRYIQGTPLSNTSYSFTMNHQGRTGSEDGQVLLRYENSQTLIESKPITLVYEARPADGPNRP
jgi:hypothetical protein